MVGKRILLRCFCVPVCICLTGLVNVYKGAVTAGMPCVIV